MMRQCCLTDRTIPVIADTSVVINLNATHRAEAILNVLPNPLLVAAEVMLELESDLQTGRNDAAALKVLLEADLVQIVQLGDIGMAHFSSLVSGPTVQTLDDGEAATIACALEMDPHAIVLMDERKANRICAERYAYLVRGSTVDLLAQDDVWTALGHTSIANALFDALHAGRMRVLQHHLKWVVDLIGPERARLCRSLPRSARSG